MSVVNNTILHLYTVTYIQSYRIYCTSQSHPRNPGSFDQGKERERQRAFHTTFYLSQEVLWIMFNPEILNEIMY